MKRSQINQIVKQFENFAKSFGFALPPFCGYTPEDWDVYKMDPAYDEIRDNMLGWDVTDYGEGNFEKLGLALVTIRNGKLGNLKYKKTYAEKLLMSLEGQISPMHFHFNKMEDIINRGGGDLMMRLYNSTPEGDFADTELELHTDGRLRQAPAGYVLRLKPGESVTLLPGMYHEWWAEGGPILIGEVSQTNDDNTDNRFYKPLARFSNLVEDEKPYRLLCNEYPK